MEYLCWMVVHYLHGTCQGFVIVFSFLKYGFLFLLFGKRWANRKKKISLGFSHLKRELWCYTLAIPAPGRLRQNNYYAFRPVRVHSSRTTWCESPSNVVTELLLSPLTSYFCSLQVKFFSCSMFSLGSPNTSLFGNRLSFNSNQIYQNRTLSFRTLKVIKNCA